MGFHQRSVCGCLQVFIHPNAVLLAKNGPLEILQFQKSRVARSYDNEINLSFRCVEICENKSPDALKIRMKHLKNMSFVSREGSADKDCSGRFHTLPRCGAI